MDKDQKYNIFYYYINEKFKNKTPYIIIKL